MTENQLLHSKLIKIPQGDFNTLSYWQNIPTGEYSFELEPSSSSINNPSSKAIINILNPKDNSNNKVVFWHDFELFRTYVNYFKEPEIMTGSWELLGSDTTRSLPAGDVSSKDYWNSVRPGVYVAWGSNYINRPSNNTETNDYAIVIDKLTSNKLNKMIIWFSGSEYSIWTLNIMPGSLNSVSWKLFNKNSYVRKSTLLPDGDSKKSEFWSELSTGFYYSESNSSTPTPKGTAFVVGVDNTTGLSKFIKSVLWFPNGVNTDVYKIAFDEPNQTRSWRKIGSSGAPGTGVSSEEIEDLKDLINEKLTKNQADLLYAKISDIPVLTEYAKKSELPNLDTYAKKSELPNLDTYAKKTDLPVLTEYALKTDIPNLAECVLRGELPDFNKFALKNQIPVLTEYAKKTDLPNLGGYALKSELPNLNGYALKTEIPTLDEYALKTDIPNLGDYAKKTELPVLTEYALKTDIPNLANYPKKNEIQELVDFSDYTLKTELNNYAKKSQIPNLDPYALKTEIPDLSRYTETDVLESDYAKKTDLPNTAIFALKNEIPDLSGYTTTDVLESEYAKKTDLPNLGGYALKTDIPNLGDYAKKTDFDAYTETSTLESDYAKKSELPDKSQIVFKPELKTQIDGLKTNVETNYALKTEVPKSPFIAEKILSDIDNFTIEPGVYFTNLSSNGTFPKLLKHKDGILKVYKFGEKLIQELITVTSDVTDTSSASTVGITDAGYTGRVFKREIYKLKGVNTWAVWTSRSLDMSVLPVGDCNSADYWRDLPEGWYLAHKERSNLTNKVTEYGFILKAGMPGGNTSQIIWYDNQSTAIYHTLLEYPNLKPWKYLNQDVNDYRYKNSIPLPDGQYNSREFWATVEPGNYYFESEKPKNGSPSNYAFVIVLGKHGTPNKIHKKVFWIPQFTDELFVWGQNSTTDTGWRVANQKYIENLEFSKKLPEGNMNSRNFWTSVLPGRYFYDSPEAQNGAPSNYGLITVFGKTYGSSEKKVIWYNQFSGDTYTWGQNGTAETGWKLTNVDSFDSRYIKKSGANGSTIVNTLSGQGLVNLSNGDNFILTMNPAEPKNTLRLIAGTAGQSGVIIVRNADKLSGFGSMCKLRKVPTDLKDTEVFGYFVVSPSEIRIGRV